MRKNSIKNTRVNGAVQKELSTIIHSEIKDPRIHPMTSVTAVEVAPDLKTCKAYISVLGDEKAQADDREDGREDEEGPGRPHSGDGDEGGQEGSDNTADGAERLQLAHGSAVVVQALGCVFHERGRHRAEQHEREHEERKAAGQRGPDQEVMLHEKRQQSGYSGDDVPARKGYGRRPDGGQQEPPVEAHWVRILVRGASAPDVAYGHGYHDRADYHRPNDL